MKIKIKGIILYKSKINKDSRGYFTEIYKKKLLKKILYFTAYQALKNLYYEVCIYRLKTHKLNL